MTILAKKFILGSKVGMTQVFEKSSMVPVTVIQAGPCVVTQVRNKEKDGYEGVQIGFGRKKIKKALQGHLKDLDSFRFMKEFSASDFKNLKRGDAIDINQFKVGDVVSVSAITKGKGFQGVVRRHGFKGFPKTHGTKEKFRAPGAIGTRWPQRVIKGKKMAGRMGFERQTVKNLRVVDVIPEDNMLLVRGSVPGTRGSLLEIKEEVWGK